LPRLPAAPWERLTFEYVLLAGVNDSDADARRVVRLLANVNCKVNLIALNPAPAFRLDARARTRVGVPGHRQKSDALLHPQAARLDIYAACGQLKSSV